MNTTLLGPKQEAGFLTTDAKLRGETGAVQSPEADNMALA